ncbi:MAG TPA: tRNA (adenosine(37)-N6)-threonylcarbamoyltransferase complex ATPase subunit type 1 TsaE [Candidatus Chromulinivoraceae bacterium]|nr:tRNA (adenosine(37)-N6)-threonylcarbamoyltransferase complex ATPase subunit type 1 TsaE [Candidatus Chromulinivoraceae bacterium]
MIIEVNGESEMKAFGKKLGALLGGGEILELIGDVGAGKTTLTKGIAAGMEVDDDVQSPSFTISRVYETPKDLSLAHYDFYRLQDAGIMAAELHEAVRDPRTVTIIEWAEIVGGVLPLDRISITIASPRETTRTLELKAGGEKSTQLLEKLT